MRTNLVKYEIYKIPREILETKAVDYRKYLDNKIIEMLLDDDKRYVYEGEVYRGDGLIQLITFENICVATGKSNNSIDIYVMIEGEDFYDLDEYQQNEIYDVYERINDIIYITTRVWL